MKIILSPTKKMRFDDQYEGTLTTPVLIDKTKLLLAQIKGYSKEALKGYLKCNDKLFEEAYERFLMMTLEPKYPAILTYDGISYKYMAPHIFSKEAINYCDKHVRIISGMYGLLRPFDGIEPYRLEMQTKIGLYAFWGDAIYQALDDHVIINLASKEYDQVIKKYIQPQDRLIDISFCQLVDGKLKEKGVYVKMARGDLVRYMCVHQITDIEDIKNYDGLGYHFSEAHSSMNHFVFLN